MANNPQVPPPPIIPPAAVPPVATAAATVAGGGSQPFISAPIVFRRAKGGGGGGRRRRNRGKKKYTRGTKQFQRLILGTEESTYDLTNGVARGFRTFVRRSKRSRRRRRDGLVRDSFMNAGRGFQRGFRVAARAPWNLGRRIATGPLWRTTRNFVVPFFTPFLGGR